MKMKNFIKLLKSYHIEDNFNIVNYLNYYDINAPREVKLLTRIIADIALCGVNYIDSGEASSEEISTIYNDAERFIFNIVGRACDCRLIDVPEMSTFVSCDGVTTINGYGDSIDYDTTHVTGVDMDGKEFRASLGLSTKPDVFLDQAYLIPYLDAINSEENSEYHFNQKTPLEQLTIRLLAADDSWEYMRIHERH